jgi:predicted transcriptional regulator
LELRRELATIQALRKINIPPAILWRRSGQRLAQICCPPKVVLLVYSYAVSIGADMAGTTTIRLPPKLRARLAVLAKQTGRSAHSIIVEAVEAHTAYEEQVRNLVREALAADVDMDKTGEVYRAEDVHAWMSRLAVDGSATRPKPWRR